MNVRELIEALKHHKNGCNGCGYEHNCKDGHCALMVQAADVLEQLNAFECGQCAKLLAENTKLHGTETTP